MSQRYRIIGVGFDHMHIGDQLATAMAHPRADVVGVCDPDILKAQAVLDELGIDAPVFADLSAAIRECVPDVAFVCSTTRDHPHLVAELARTGVHVILEKPLADSQEAADRMAADAERGGIVLTVNWPLAWFASHRTAHRLASTGAIGRIEQVHFYDGNRGPLFHGHGKLEKRPSTAEKAVSWWYQPESGGGSLRDYLGYGTTMGTWFRGGEMPRAVTAAWHVPDGLKVDEQSVVIGHYANGLSVFETRWGTQSDPWTLQPQPHCGFVLNGTHGSISSWDYDDGITLHREGRVERIPNDDIAPEDQSALSNLIAHLDTGRPLDGPLSQATSMAGHRIIEAAVRSAASGVTVELEDDSR